jgi:hypothetical protein
LRRQSLLGAPQTPWPTCAGWETTVHVMHARGDVSPRVVHSPSGVVFPLDASKQGFKGSLESVGAPNLTSDAFSTRSEAESEVAGAPSMMIVISSCFLSLSLSLSLSLLFLSSLGSEHERFFSPSAPLPVSPLNLKIKQLLLSLSLPQTCLSSPSRRKEREEIEQVLGGERDSVQREISTTSPSPVHKALSLKDSFSSMFHSEIFDFN